MPLDASIAMGIQPLKLENPINSLAAALQVKAAQAQLQKNQQEVEDTNKLNALYSQSVGTDGKVDRQKLFQNLATQNMGSKLPTIQKSFYELDESQNKADKGRVDLVDAKLKQSRSMLDTVRTPQEYLAWHEANYADPVLGPTLAARGVTAESARKQIEQALQTPGGFEELLQKSALGIEKFTEHYTQSANNKASIDASNANAAAARAVTMRGQNMTDVRAKNSANGGASPYHTFIPTANGIYAADARTGQVIKAYDADGNPIIRDSSDPELQGRIAGAKTGAETDAKAVGQAKADQAAQERIGSAIREVKELLPDATNSGIGAMIDAGARQLGATTKGAQNAARLETLAGWMTANVPRMEGPQSDKDTQQYQQMAAKVGDRTVPYKERLAAISSLENLQAKYAKLNQEKIGSGNTPKVMAPKRSLDEIFGGGQ